MKEPIETNRSLLYLHIQCGDGEERVYGVEFDSQEDLRNFLEEAEKLAHIKALVEISGELPFYVTWRVRRYEGKAYYDPSMESSHFQS